MMFPNSEKELATQMKGEKCFSVTKVVGNVMIFWKRPKFPFNYRNKEKWYFEEISESLGNIPASYILFIYVLFMYFLLLLGYP